MTWGGLTPPYATIVADPPWPTSWQQGAGHGGRRRRSTRLTYTTLSVEEIAALGVGDLAAEQSHLYLWITPQRNREGAGVLVAEAWGFHVTAEIIWEKPNFGLGAFPRPTHEILLVGVRGGLPHAGPFDVRSVQHWPQSYAAGNGGKQHSVKPAAALDLVQRVSPGPYVELFARQPRLGWDSWGWGYEQAAGQ